MKFEPVSEDESTKRVISNPYADANFLDKVYEQVKRVPEGRVCTYGDIADMAGYPGAARAVGVAMSRIQSESNLPAHRIVNAKGTLAPNYAFGGKSTQREMLQAEGISFILGAKEDTINMDECRWPQCDIPQKELSENEQLSLWP